jgi:hypothetical protein
MMKRLENTDEAKRRTIRRRKEEEDIR